MLVLCLMQVSDCTVLCTALHVFDYSRLCILLETSGEIAWLEPLLVADVTPVTDDVGDGVVVAVLSTAAPRRQTHLTYAKGNLCKDDWSGRIDMEDFSG